MHGVLTVLLIGGLVASIVSFVFIGLLQYRRARSLARRAQEADMQFSAADPFDLPTVLADFALVQCGHSPRAENVIYGRVDGRLVRAFDFRYEVGHGTQRQTRAYRVLTLEPPGTVASVLMWHEQDVPAAPLSLRRSHQRAGRWLYRGSPRLARAMVEVCQTVACPVNVQTGDATVMLFLPAKSYARAYEGGVLGVLKAAQDAVAILDRHGGVRRPPQKTSRPGR